MSYTLPPDIDLRVESQLDAGLYNTRDDVLRAALAALEREHEDFLAIKAGIEDMEAGRHQPFAQFDREFRRSHNLPPFQ